MSNEIFEKMQEPNYVFILMMVIIILQIISLVIATLKKGSHEIQKKEPQLWKERLSQELSERQAIEKVVRQTIRKIQSEQGRDTIVVPRGK